MITTLTFSSNHKQDFSEHMCMYVDTFFNYSSTSQHHEELHYVNSTFPIVNNKMHQLATQLKHDDILKLFEELQIFKYLTSVLDIKGS